MKTRLLESAGESRVGKLCFQIKFERQSAGDRIFVLRSPYN